MAVTRRLFRANSWCRWQEDRQEYRRGWILVNLSKYACLRVCDGAAAGDRLPWKLWTVGSSRRVWKRCNNWDLLSLVVDDISHAVDVQEGLMCMVKGSVPGLSCPVPPLSPFKSCPLWLHGARHQFHVSCVFKWFPKGDNHFSDLHSVSLSGFICAWFSSRPWYSFHSMEVFGANVQVLWPGTKAWVGAVVVVAVLSSRPPHSGWRRYLSIVSRPSCLRQFIKRGDHPECWWRAVPPWDTETAPQKARAEESQRERT